MFSLLVKSGIPITFGVPEFADLYITKVVALSKPAGSGILYFELNSQEYPLCHLNTTRFVQHSLFLKINAQSTATFGIKGNITVQLTGYLKPLHKSALLNQQTIANTFDGDDYDDDVVVDEQLIPSDLNSPNGDKVANDDNSEKVSDASTADLLGVDSSLETNNKSN